MPNKSQEKVPRSVAPVYSAIVELTDQVCRAYLNEEYEALARKAAAKLARKRPTPLTRGKKEIWACAIVYALGSTNFLFDKTNEPYMSPDELCKAFQASRSSAYNKSKWIRDTLNMDSYNHEWLLPSRLDDHPGVWLLEVNGFIMDVRDLPREIQEMAYQQGLIPYIPADRKKRDS